MRAAILIIAAACSLSACSLVKKHREKQYQLEQSSEASRVQKEMEERTRTVIDETLDTILLIPQRAQKLEGRPVTVNPLTGLWTATLFLDSLNTTLKITVDSANHTIGVEATQAGQKIPAKSHKRTTIASQKTAKSDSSGKKKAKTENLHETQEKEKEPDYSWMLWLGCIIGLVAGVLFFIGWLRSKFPKPPVL